MSSRWNTCTITNGYISCTIPYFNSFSLPWCSILLIDEHLLENIYLCYVNNCQHLNGIKAWFVESMCANPIPLMVTFKFLILYQTCFVDTDSIIKKTAAPKEQLRLMNHLPVVTSTTLWNHHYSCRLSSI